MDSELRILKSATGKNAFKKVLQTRYVVGHQYVGMRTQENGTLTSTHKKVYSEWTDVPHITENTNVSVGYVKSIEELKTDIIKLELELSNVKCKSIDLKHDIDTLLEGSKKGLLHRIFYSMLNKPIKLLGDQFYG